MLNVMVIGCGAISHAHIKAYLAFKDKVKITHLINRDIERAKNVNKEYNLNAQVASDYNEYLTQVDVVSICTPLLTHAEIAVNSLQANCHIILEKPMAMTLVECDDIIKAAEKSGMKVAVVAQSRFISNAKNSIDIIKSNKYGKNLYARVNSQWYRGQEYYDLEYRGRWLSDGGGCTLNHTIHHIDLLTSIKGMPKTIRAYMTNLQHDNSEVEDFSSSLLEYEDGSVCEITSSLISHGEEQGLYFQNENVGISIPFAAYVSTSKENGFPVTNENLIKQVNEEFSNMPKLKHEHHEGQIENFIHAIIDNDPLISTIIEGKNVIEIITGIYKSAITKETVTFPIAKNDEFYNGKWREKAQHFHEKTKNVKYFDDVTITDFKNKY